MLFSALFTLALALPAFSAPVEKAVALEKRRTTYSGQATFYDVGLGACGGTNVATDYIVALNTAQYGSGYPGPHCGKAITISYGGKQVGATIEDECPTCAYGALDMSTSLFLNFATENDGVFQMTWWYDDDDSSEETTTSSKKTSTYVAPTSTYTPPTSTYTPPTSTYTPPTSTYTPPTSTYTPPTSTYTPPTSTSSYTPPTSTYVAPSSSSSQSPSSSIEPSTSPSAVPSTISSSAAASSSSASSAASSIISTSSFPDVVVVQTNATVASSTGVNSTRSGSASASATASAAPLESSVSELAAFGNLVTLNQAVVNLGRILVVGAQE
ncbi:hypothetical protein L198_02250 [Cryptococcus wingfieldii CBS 7118]|uniref:B2-aldehyde-forming enzyme n=1 Tax=Cryptococcus wingfieldii CBS 7118 TaxID=1295528 RepID=A0A1E3JRF0_9TREE|nr:hypothetical protein L198_02250 [Cryptococcus wingfieldii CBS 7118]ODO03403.1 hypothetical protein L198_02250 [Cryptococcus wingfieldii CBS 7118]